MSQDHVFRDGKVARWEDYADRSVGLAAAGVSA
jgi:hypothetical protein